MTAKKTYGSEYHLHRYRCAAPKKLDQAIRRAGGASSSSKIEWMYPGSRPQEPQGLDFLEDGTFRDDWHEFWSTRGEERSGNP